MIVNNGKSIVNNQQHCPFSNMKWENCPFSDDICTTEEVLDGLKYSGW